jgi:2-amino-4-hydroxy-6-hydroxymethyldihydropteridine diphosphokinase
VGRHINNGIFLLLGSNQGHPLENLSAARMRLEKDAGKIIKQSAVYRTAAWGKTDQPDFYNQVIELSSALNGEELLGKILTIEKDLGRVRSEKWGSRTIDIDILFIGGLHIDSPDLKVPHPGIAERKFTLVPLAEIAPEFWHPVLHKKVSALLEACADPLGVEVVSEGAL